MTEPVLFETLPAPDGYAIGVAMLNRPQTLNALTLPMIRTLDAQLAAWALDPSMACVVLGGAGDKGFCAGGDVRALRAALLDTPQPAPHPDASAFFAAEYALDYRIHTYGKPLIVWGHGIVMGGGMGLLQGASHRVLTPDSRLAMPEISIGLYPDAGGSWFLARMPALLGRFLALTGAPLGAGDALAGNLGDVVLEREQWPQLLERLCGCRWSPSAHTRHGQVSALLARLQSPDTRPSAIAPLLHDIQRLMGCGGFAEVCQALAGRHFAHPWLQQAQQTFRQGSPLSAAIGWQAQQRARHLSLAETLRMELDLSVQVVAAADFCEGVRAQLVDKDRTPRWAETEMPDERALERFFRSPWSPDAHPLAELR